MFSLDMLDCPMYSLSSSTWNFLCWMGWGDHSKSVLLFGFLCGTPPSCLKVAGWWWWWWVVVVAYRILVSAQVLVFCPGPGPGQDLTGPELDWTWLDLTWTWLDLNGPEWTWLDLTGLDLTWTGTWSLTKTDRLEIEMGNYLCNSYQTELMKLCTVWTEL